MTRRRRSRRKKRPNWLKKQPPPLKRQQKHRPLSPWRTTGEVSQLQARRTRCEPVSTPGPDADSGDHHATWLPMPSVSTERPRAAHSAANHSRSSFSADAHGWRL